MDGLGVAVLRGLDQEDHQEGDDGGAGVDDQLPGIAQAKQRAGDAPHHDDQQRETEGHGLAGHARGHFRKACEPGRRFRRSHDVTSRRAQLHLKIASGVGVVCKGIGSREWDRTTDHLHVKEVLYH